MRRKYAVLAGWMILCGATLGACSGTQLSKEDFRPTIVPKPNFHLRTSIDQDPSTYLGRFVPADVDPNMIDDSEAMQLSCSRFFTIKKIPAAGIEYDEYFQASVGASASIGIPEVKLAVSAGRGKVVRIKYTATEKWVAHLDDPAGFEACCKQAPDQCTGTYLGEFLAGTGVIYAMAYEKSEAGISGSIKGIPAEADFKDGVTWRRAIAFTQPAFFAFKTTRTPYKTSGGAEMCGEAWDVTVPKSSQGYFFVGVSDWVQSERVARDQASLNARRQVVHFLGEEIRQGGIRRELTGGAIDALETKMKDDSVVDRASAGVARFVKDECWKPEKAQGPNGWRYQAKVLTFIPKSEVEAAAKVMGEEIDLPE